MRTEQLTRRHRLSRPMIAALLDAITTAPDMRGHDFRTRRALIRRGLAVLHTGDDPATGGLAWHVELNADGRDVARALSADTTTTTKG
ncbi:hypothetical protein ACWDTT_15895 [Streptosporangium sandarakinum]